MEQGYTQQMGTFQSFYQWYRHHLHWIDLTSTWGRMSGKALIARMRTWCVLQSGWQGGHWLIYRVRAYGCLCTLKFWLLTYFEVRKKLRCHRWARILWSSWYVEIEESMHLSTAPFLLLILSSLKKSGAMGFIVGMIGAVSGYGIAVMTNAARKIPLSRGTFRFVAFDFLLKRSFVPCSLNRYLAFSSEPWNHVMFSIFGYWAGNYYVKTERQLVQEINEIRADKGLPSLVGTHTYEWTSWVRLNRFLASIIGCAKPFRRARLPPWESTRMW